MKHPITDALQVIAAITITTAMVVANAAPLPKQVEHKDVAVVVQKSVPAPTQTTPESTQPAETTIDPPAAETAVQAPVVAQTPVYSGSHEDWLTAAGIDQSQWGFVDFIVTHESGWNPCAYYPNQSDCSLTAAQINATGGGYGVACGLGMSLSCGKWGENWTDPVNQLVHMNDYVQKYGGWAGAVSHWQAYKSY